METVLYEFKFDYFKALGFFPILLISAALFWGAKQIGRAAKMRSKPLLDPARPTIEVSPKTFQIILQSLSVGCLVVFLLFFGSFLFEYKQYKTALDNDNVWTIEGYVENYSPLPADEKGTENFEINGVCFAYSNNGVNGYQTTATRGGVVTHNGQHLKIKYIVNDEGENVILYIAKIQ
ncbi:MAG: hypothetical protein IJF33_05785 [Clostridia bacterium]|nr:hypothetical protein [Clostridia bacterium]